MEQNNTNKVTETQKVSNPLLQSREHLLNNVDEHNMELVAEVKGASYVNDSKSLSVDVTLNSLNSIKANTLLIIGGADKGADYTKIFTEHKRKLKAIIYLGTEEGNILKNYKAGTTLYVTALNIEEAVRTAYWYARENDVVLFSPACQPMAFESYRARGEEFKKAVSVLRG